MSHASKASHDFSFGMELGGYGRSGEITLTGYPSFSVVSIMYCMLFLTSTFVVDASVLETRKRI